MATNEFSYQERSNHFTLSAPSFSSNSNTNYRNESVRISLITPSRKSTTMHSAGGSQNCFVMILRSRIMKVMVLIGFSLMFTAVYVNYFQHPPADMILAMNSGALGGAGSDFGSRHHFGPPLRQSNVRKSNTDDDDGGEAEDGDDNDDDDGNDNADDGNDGGEDDDHKDRNHAAGGDDRNHNDKSVVRMKVDGRRQVKSTSGVKFEDYWADFLKRNRLVSIGAVYDKCENWDVQFGVVALMEDKEFGGVKSRTYMNLTVDKELNGGQFNLEVKYNGKDLYDNYWDLCELEDEIPPQNRTFNCPVAAGKHSKVKDKHIPKYLPKGRYQSKGWVTDEDEKIIGCGYSDFTI